MNRLFTAGDILLPENTDMSLWSVIACDQFTSQPEYWEGVEERVGPAPSTLRMILPEAFLELRDRGEALTKANAAMDMYLEKGLFTTLEDSFIYVEREMTVGGIRRGILGLVDLEAYDYSPEARTPVRCTEGTVERRLPPRVELRRGAALELPHVVVFADDPEWSLFQGLDQGEKLYDFELMDGGGRIVGRRVSGQAARRVESAMEELGRPERLEKRYNLMGKAPAVLAMGDGNHSLAAAKLYWEQLKPTLSPEQRENHPARRSLVELVNIHDDTVRFEPIHRVLFGIDPEKFETMAEEYFDLRQNDADKTCAFRLITAKGEREFKLAAPSPGEAIKAGQELCENYVNRYGGVIDYIHDDDTALTLAAGENCGGMLFPALEKDSLFPSIIESGAFPAKSFSIGPARDKRYYLECRKIK